MDSAAARPAGRAGHSPRRRGRLAAETLFFPAAAMYGAAAVPLSVHGMVSGRPLLPGLGGIAGHAHELLFGYALAVVTGFLVTRASGLQLTILAGAWLAARAAFLAAPGSVPALVANAGFAALLGALVVPQFLRGAKKLRNKAIAPILVALCLAAGAFQLADATAQPGLRFLVLRETVLVLALLMLFMGGRIIAPAAAGAIERAGGRLDARVQPRIEGALLVTMGLAIPAAAIPGAGMLAGALLMAAAGLALVRLLRWRLWACRSRPDLWCLGLGYGWLALGLAALGLAWTSPLVTVATATHAITVGALGTLTTAVMARVRLTRTGRDPARASVLPWIALLIGLAAITRLAGGTSVAALGLAALLWSTGLLLVLLLLLRVPAR